MPTEEEVSKMGNLKVYKNLVRIRKSIFKRADRDITEVVSKVDEDLARHYLMQLVVRHYANSGITETERRLRNLPARNDAYTQDDHCDRHLKVIRPDGDVMVIEEEKKAEDHCQDPPSIVELGDVHDRRSEEKYESNNS